MCWLKNIGGVVRGESNKMTLQAFGSALNQVTPEKGIWFVHLLLCSAEKKSGLASTKP